MTISSIEREMERMSRALCANPGSDRHAELYAAQQALAWALDPNAAQSPHSFVMGSGAGSEGCSAGSRRLPSSDTPAPTLGGV